MNDNEIDLGRAEAELAREEALLFTELERLALAKADLDQKRDLALAQVMEARGLGATDQAIAERLAALKAPELSLEAPLGKARAHRDAAVKARRLANQLATQHLVNLRHQLSDVTRQLKQDELAATQLLAQSRAKARAAEEAARQAELAPPPPPPPPPMAAQVPSALEATRKAPSGVAGLRGKPKEEPHRIQHRVPMQCQVDFHSDDNFYSGFSSNLSDGGLFVATVNLQRLGTEVDVNFTLPTGEHIQAKGVVRWVREVNDRIPDAFPGMGVQFTDLAEEAQAAIHRFLQQREPMFYAA